MGYSTTLRNKRWLGLINQSLVTICVSIRSISERALKSQETFAFCFKCFQLHSTGEWGINLSKVTCTGFATVSLMIQIENQETPIIQI